MPALVRKRTIREFEDLEVFQLARNLTQEVYRATSAPGLARDFILRDQLRRSAVSIMSNVAEGFERDGDREFLQFLSHANGSCGELRAQLYVAIDQEYLDQNRLNALAQTARTLSRRLARFIEYLRTSTVGGKKFRSSSSIR